MCSIQRRLDTKTQPRIEAAQVDLMNSGALLFELGRNPHPVRKEYALKVLAKATVFVRTDDEVVERSRRFHADG